MNKGRFSGVGIGPGDPDLVTLKAVKKIRECSVIALPVSDRELQNPLYEKAGSEEKTCYAEGCAAYRIARQAENAVTGKDRIYLPMPMIRDRAVLKRIHDRDAEAVADLLDRGRDVVFLTLGDPTVYSTCMYVHKRLCRAGYDTEIIPGVTSFCAAAARMNIPLAENRQEIHVLPASYDIEKSMSLPGTKILMKAGKKMSDVRRMLLKNRLEAEMVENCGMENERIYRSAEEIPDEAGYYSLLIVKESKREG